VIRLKSEANRDQHAEAMAAVAEEKNPEDTVILDATCGGRSIWHEDNKDREDTLYIDIREQDDPEHIEMGQDRGRTYTVEPDDVQDFRDLPYPDESFHLIVWDPPHVMRANGMQQLNGIMVRKYGALHAETWQADLRKGFEELWRVLKPNGTLCFKFADDAADFEEVLDLFPVTPLFGTTTNQHRTDTRWFVFHKSCKEG
jgi:SAM-dependent methyltransferase